MPKPTIEAVTFNINDGVSHEAFADAEWLLGQCLDHDIMVQKAEYFQVVSE